MSALLAVRVTDWAAVVVIAQPPREFTTGGGGRIGGTGEPAELRLRLEDHAIEPLRVRKSIGGGGNGSGRNDDATPFQPISLS